MSDLCDGLARWATSLELEAIPQPVAQATRRALVDATGCMLAGATTPVSQTLRHQAAGVFTSGRCRVLGNALRLNPLGAAQLNGAAAGTLEMDPGFESGRVPAVGVVFAAVLAATEQTGTPRGDMFTGLVVGLEVAARLSFLLRDGLDAAPDDLATQICAISAALGTARALALDEDAAAQAMRIAASIHGGLALTSGTSVRPLQMGLAAEAAVRAVLLADSGMGGPDSAVEGEQALGRYAAATM
ncbi:MAG: MmgE/PrpD family protein, partial [Rhodospirillaceae bacterium]